MNLKEGEEIIQDEVKKDEKDLITLFKIFKKRKFTGNTGIAIKNSTFQFGTTLISKIGSLVFLVFLARLLTPEYFGLYTLTLSTIMIFVTFSDFFSVNQTLIRFLSIIFEKNETELAKNYTQYLFRIKLLLIITSGILLAFLSNYIANNIYHKPISLALYMGVLYLFLTGLISFFESLFQSKNNFKLTFFKEIIFQVSRIILVPLSIFFLIKEHTQINFFIFWVFLALSFCLLIVLFFLFFYAKKDFKFKYLTFKKVYVPEKKELHKFMFGMLLLAISSVLYGYIDKIMLGRYVSAEFIGFYEIALNIVLSVSSLIIFSTALFPIFSRLSGKRLEKAFDKSLRVTLVFSVISLLVLLFFSETIISLFFGQNYINSSFILKGYSLIIIASSLTSIYSSYFVAIGRPKIVTFILSFIALFDVLLNFFFIKLLLPLGQLEATFGAVIATVVTRYIYLFALIIARRKYNK